MKYVIASDIHGSAKSTRELLSRFSEEKADKLILLGDLYNHGPRNPFPDEYAPMDVATLLNGVKDRLIVVKGNCDSDVDTLISEFDFLPHLLLETDGCSVFLTHGDAYDCDRPPKTAFDAVVYGHYHQGVFTRKGKTLFVNVGSVSLPKDGFQKNYLVLENGFFILKTLSGEEIKSVSVKE